MSGADHLIPPGVDQADGQMLRRAYELHDAAESAQLYREWAATYDRTMVDGLGYESFRLLVGAFADVVVDRSVAVLDIGCGTGLVGSELALRGYTTIDGLDISTEMMGVAATRNVYRRFLAGDLNQPLDISTAAYSAVICNGTFTSGHVGPGCLDELVRIIELGGWLACAVHHSVWHASGFDAAFDRLTASGRLRSHAMIEARYYATSTSSDGLLCVFQRTTG